MTVMSPAVNTATARAAAAMAPQCAAQRDTQQDADRPEVEQCRLLQLGLDRTEPDAHDQDDPRQGRQRMHDGGPDESDQDRPNAEGLGSAGIPKRSQPGRRVQRQGHERRQTDDGQQQPAAPGIRAKEKECQHDTQRQGDRLGGRDQRDRLDREPSGSRQSALCREASPPNRLEIERSARRGDECRCGALRPAGLREPSRSPASRRQTISARARASPLASRLEIRLTAAIPPRASGPPSSRMLRSPTRRSSPARVNIPARSRSPHRECRGP